MSSLYKNNRKAEDIRFSSFLLNYENNSFDNISNEAIDNHIKKIDDLNSSNKQNDGLENIINLMFLEQELKALAEMKLVYAYKSFEFHLKFLLKNYYPELKKSELYKWDTVLDFLKSKNIDPKKINCFKEIDELRNINNAIKHSSIINSRILPIEFKDESHITYKNILAFYDRIENCGIEFFKSLYEFIKVDIYYFDEDKINEQVEKVEKTMTPEMAIDFANKILKKYT